MRPLRVLVTVVFLVALAVPMSASAAPVTAHASLEVNQDTDGDGFPDGVDQCPTQPGTFNGCPSSSNDSDHDGVSDASDRCPDTIGPASNAGCPLNDADTDHDGVQDSLDKCPTIPYSGTPVAGSGGLGCPPTNTDSDRDGISDVADKCPSVPGRADLGGCPANEAIDSDGDGVADADDKCANTRPDTDYRGEKVGTNGCPPLLVNLFYHVELLKFLVADTPGSLTADCAYNLGVPCVMNATVMLSAKTARAAHLRKRVISRLTIHLTTPKQQDDAHPQYYKVPGAAPRQGTLRLRLTKATRRKLWRLKAVTITVAASYRLGSAGPVSIGSDTCTIYKKPRSTNTCRLTNAPVAADKVND